ncbi:B9 domain-containing protein 2 [Phytophthora citrophthora]|uniref:B9 domain-containing protein 2 n=1 Tax=Phytophthora citrophthora TaxID=4793 RepID=A0AAD9G5X2_9STRA|nr:B9 domain-containing protein 2 [Phytophthora citrophthora]
MKLPKPDKKHALVDKKKKAKSLETLDQEHSATRDKDPLTSPKSDVESESPKRKSRWKIPDRKHHSTKTSNNQKEAKEPEEIDSKSHKPPLSPTSDNNAPSSRENSPSPRVRSKKIKKGRKNNQQPSIDSSSGDSEQENQTNVLSPLRRHKADPDDTLPIPEAPYVPSRVQQRLSQLDVPPAYQPEVHLIGEIVSGHGFGMAGGLTCKWRVEYGSRWSHIAGDQFGQTQSDYPSTAPWTSEPDVAVWSHPIDLHFATSAFQGWPKLLFQVWRADSSMKLHVVGYGFVPVPFAAGQHKLWVSLWRPLGSTIEEIDAQVLGRTTELKSDDVLFNAAWSERCRLRTVSTGRVLVHIGVLLRHFQTGVIEA